MDNTVCRICGKEFKHLGSHIWHKHGMRTRPYKQKFGIDYKFPLISQEVKEKKQAAWHADKKKYLKNLLGKESLKHRFKKGAVPPRDYVSEMSKTRTLTNLEKMNNLIKRHGPCPVCGYVTKHVEAHLYNKHGLLVRDRNKLYGESE